MGKYNFDYGRLEKLEAENRAIIAVNGEMRKRIEELTEIINEMKSSKKSTVSKRQYRDVFTNETYENLFGCYPDSNGIISPCNSKRQEMNCTNFIKNIMLLLLPKAHLIQDKKVTRTERYNLSTKSLSDMSEKEYKIARKTIQYIAITIEHAKKYLELDLTDDQIEDMFAPQFKE